MICAPCAAAADNRLARDFHCEDPKCMCGHRVERYQPQTITVVHATPPMPVTACDEGRHRAHPGETCAEYETDRNAMRAAWDRLMGPINEELAAMDETCTTFSEHGWGRCVEPADHAPGKHMYRNPKL